MPENRLPRLFIPPTDSFLVAQKATLLAESHFLPKI